MVKRPLLELLPALPTALPFPVVFTEVPNDEKRECTRVLPEHQKVRSEEYKEERRTQAWNMKHET